VNHNPNDTPLSPVEKQENIFVIKPGSKKKQKMIKTVLWIYVQG
jgi:hypothetical protein